LRILVLDAQTFDVGPQLLELALHALHVHRLHISALARAGGGAARRVSDLYGASA
jgi:hypothetical protein